MRPKVVRGVTTVLLTITVILPIGASPAAAFNPAAVIAVIKEAYSLYQNYVANQLTLAEATRQILDAIADAKNDIIAQIDRVATAEVRSCATSAIIDFKDIESFSDDNLQAFARDATECATHADSLLSAVSDKAAIDQLGFALDAVGPVALVARSRARLSTDLLRGSLAHGNTSVINRLITDADCTYKVEPDDNPNYVYPTTMICTAYNGEVGQETRLISWRPPGTPHLNYSVAKSRATQNTSRAAATAVLPLLQ